jgi:hypothetical protein
VISVLSTKKINSFFMVVFLTIFLFLPATTYSLPSEATQNDRTGITYECGDGQTAGECDFNDLLGAVKRVVDYAVGITLAFSVIVIAYVGGEYIVYADNPSKRSAANDRLVKVLKGMAFIMTAWLIVTLITNSLLKENIIRDVVPLR